MSPPGHPVHHFTDRGHSQPPHLVSEIVRVRLARLGVGLISPDRGRLPTDRRPTRRRKDSAVDVPLGCPLPAVLPAVSRSVRRFLTRSDPQSPSVFPTNAGFLGDFAESGTGSKPGAVRNGAVQHLGSLEPRRVEIPREVVNDLLDGDVVAAPARHAVEFPPPKRASEAADQ